MATTDQNRSLISSHPSTSGLKINLHPLALLTISDYITRHTLRNTKGPIVGALLGAQDGRTISIEHAYEIKWVDEQDSSAMDIEGDTRSRTVDDNWFKTKLQQFKDIHKTLDIVGHFTLLLSPPNNTPTLQHLQTHTELLPYNESLIFLGFHPSQHQNTGGKLPLTCWESIYEEEQGPGESKELKMKFVEMDYTIETGEAEMIAVSYVAAGTANASDEVTTTTRPEPKSETTPSKDKGKGKAADKPVEVADQDIELPIQTQELIANLNAKSGAIHMLHSRLTLLLAYLETIQNESSPTNPPPYRLLRSLSALITRLSLLEPPSTTASSLQHEQLAEQSDVLLAALLGYMTKSVNEVRKVGAKYAVVAREGEQHQHQKMSADFESGGGGGRQMDPRGKGMMDFLRRF